MTKQSFPDNKQAHERIDSILSGKAKEYAEDWFSMNGKESPKVLSIELSETDMVDIPLGQVLSEEISSDTSKGNPLNPKLTSSRASSESKITEQDVESESSNFLLWA